MVQIATFNFPDAIRGDTYDSTTLTITNTSTGLPVSLIGVQIKLQLKLSPLASALLTLSNGKGITIINEATGIIRIDEMIITIPAGKYIYDMQFTFSNGEIRTLLKGTFTVLQDITN